MSVLSTLKLGELSYDVGEVMCIECIFDLMIFLLVICLSGCKPTVIKEYL